MFVAYHTVNLTKPRKARCSVAQKSMQCFFVISITIYLAQVAFAVRSLLCGINQNLSTILYAIAYYMHIHIQLIPDLQAIRSEQSTAHAQHVVVRDGDGNWHNCMLLHMADGSCCCHRQTSRQADGGTYGGTNGGTYGGTKRQADRESTSSGDSLACTRAAYYF